MKNILVNYMNERMKAQHKPDKPGKSSSSGPVVTLSREPGCPGKNIANKIKEIVHKEFKTEWTVISKEIFEHSAKELNLHVDKVHKVLHEDRSAFDEILSAFSNKTFKNERVIRKTVFDLIHAFACDGHYIIIGRGGNIIAADIPKSLHIRLYAPEEWRINRLMHFKGMTREEATGYIAKIEKERAAFRKLMKGKATNKDDFDVIINCAHFTQHEIANIIIAGMKEKKVLP